MSETDYQEELNQIMSTRSQDEAHCAAQLEDLIDKITAETSGEQNNAIFEQVLNDLLSVYISLRNSSNRIFDFFGKIV